MTTAKIRATVATPTAAFAVSVAAAPAAQAEKAQERPRKQLKMIETSGELHMQATRNLMGS